MLKGKTYEQIYGVEKAMYYRNLRKNKKKNNTNSLRNRTYEDIYGVEKSKKLREQKQLWAIEHPLSKETRIKIGLKQHGMKKPSVSEKLRGRKLNKVHCDKIINAIRERNKDKDFLRKFSLAMIASYDRRGIIRHGKYPREFNNDLKKSITSRDASCVICGSVKRLCVHHIDYYTNNNDYYNLCSLCISCHMRTNFNRDKWKEFLNTLLRNRYKVLGEISERYEKDK